MLVVAGAAPAAATAAAAASASASSDAPAPAAAKGKGKGKSKAAPAPSDPLMALLSRSGRPVRGAALGVRYLQPPPDAYGLGADDDATDTSSSGEEEREDKRDIFRLSGRGTDDGEGLHIDHVGDDWVGR